MRNVFFVDSTGLDMMGQVQKMMKYQEDKKQVLFNEPSFCCKTPAFFTGPTILQVPGSLGKT